MICAYIGGDRGGRLEEAVGVLEVKPNDGVKYLEEPYKPPQ
ncbi:hypothetical protein TUZN_1787 [Thermoproteus uzoniensis 768-20]|uniref:Uncharacterized protein n=1 Tax=Thermoproteus uzoniensis (strain 768-20) TaxID=999630 RepID=F2L3K9_THEU7|nr:hypothetical protein [Thermoproteus uzoniensis]AEA13248.1 hypothetical protein TUZN_1787 [Thermoproteus uzoniensis 768-20]